MLLALCLVLPMITGGIPKIGNMLCPMHIPVLLCGFICGWQYGGIIGFIAPLMRSVIFGAPIMYPMALCMAFELCTYGVSAGLALKLMPRKNIFIYPALIISMIAGRAVWGAARLITAGVSGSAFGFSAFISGAFTAALPGIILQLVIIPPIVMALRKTKIIS